LPQKFYEIFPVNRVAQTEGGILPSSASQNWHKGVVSLHKGFYSLLTIVKLLLHITDQYGRGWRARARGLSERWVGPAPATEVHLLESVACFWHPDPKSVFRLKTLNEPYCHIPVSLQASGLRQVVGTPTQSIGDAIPLSLSRKTFAHLIQSCLYFTLCI
jgi:hypothetical protein